MRLEHVPEVWLRLPGSEARARHDTGSVGIVVSSEHYVPAPGDVEGGPGQLPTAAAASVLHGTYLETDVEIMSGRDGGRHRARQVLRVDDHLPDRARSCEPRERPRRRLHGIGFARGGGSLQGPGRRRRRAQCVRGLTRSPRARRLPTCAPDTSLPATPCTSA